MPKLTEAIKHLIIINAILFIAPQLLNMDLTNILALHFPKNEHFGFWQYVSHIFMHGSPMHIIFNMYGLWAFGTPLEQMWGRNKFIFFYFSAGIGAGLIYTLVNYYQFNGIYEQLINLGVTPGGIQNILTSGSYNDELITLTNEKMTEFYSLYHTPAVGASGAVFGIFAAYATYFPNQKIYIFPLPIPIKNMILITILVISDLTLGIFSLPGDNVGRFAHVGGAIIGFIIAKYWKKNSYV